MLLRILMALMLCVSACHHNDNDPGSNPPAPAPKPVDPSDPQVLEGTLDNSGPYAVIRMPSGKQYHTGLLKEPEETKKLGKQYITLADADCDNMPKDFDLRVPEIATVPELKDQGNCGSCWAYSQQGSFMSALLKAGKKLILSEQDSISCDHDQWGCNGGLMNGFKYQINHGIALESDYANTSWRTGVNGQCKNAPVAAKGISYKYIGTADRGPTEKELKCALYKYHIVPWIIVGATSAWGSPPASERTPYTRCGAQQTNHAVNVVGWWTDQSGTTQWLMKNSWGKGWGDNGYMSLKLGCNSFGEEVGFIEVDMPPTPTPTPPGPGPTPTPGPCTQVPNVKMEVESQYLAGTELMLGVRSEPGVTYSWYVDGQLVPGETMSMYYFKPIKDVVVKLKGVNQCGNSESATRVRQVMSLKN